MEESGLNKCNNDPMVQKVMMMSVRTIIMKITSVVSPLILGLMLLFIYLSSIWIGLASFEVLIKASHFDLQS